MEKYFRTADAQICEACFGRCGGADQAGLREAVFLPEEFLFEGAGGMGR